jgi:ATP-binding cassette, subfamily B, bacterial MsbA
MIEFLRKIWALTRPYRGRLLLGVAAGVLGGLIEPLMIATVAFVYALIFPSANAAPVSERLTWAPAFVKHWANGAQEALSTSMSRHPGAIIVLVAAIPAIVMLRSLLNYLNVYFLQWTAVRAVTDLRARIFEHLMSLSAGFFSRTSTGELMARTMADTAALQNVISNSMAVMVKDPVMIVGLLTWLIWHYFHLTFISLAIMPVCVVPILIYNRKARRSSREMQSNTAEMSTVMVESFSGHRIVKAYNLEPMVLAQFRETARKFIGHYMRLIRSQEIPGPMLESFGAVGVSLVLIYLARLGDRRPTGEDFLVVILLLFSMYRPLKNLARLYNNLEVARAASERAFELLATRNDVPEPAQPKPLRAAGSAIRFEGVDFAYGEKLVLRNINLTVAPGRLVALVGATGSGKTTITNLLLRFYDPTRGAVRIGDTDLREISTDDLRRQIAVVTQETVLFNQTIARNIELGRPGATREQIIEAARHAHAYDFIMERPDGFDAVIGERGNKLSGGQRQRLAIARALLKDAPILVLDEATSALDTKVERAVQEALDQLMVGRTTICIAHRLSTVQHADLIVVVEQGRIVETGTHAELLKLQGVYAKLHALQFEPGRDHSAGSGL